MNKKSAITITISAIIEVVAIAVILLTSFYVVNTILSTFSDQQALDGFEKFIEPISKVCKGEPNAEAGRVSITVSGKTYVLAQIDVPDSKTFLDSSGVSTEVNARMEKCAGGTCLCLLKINENPVEHDPWKSLSFDLGIWDIFYSSTPRHSEFCQVNGKCSPPWYYSAVPIDMIQVVEGIIIETIAATMDAKLCANPIALKTQDWAETICKTVVPECTNVNIPVEYIIALTMILDFVNMITGGAVESTVGQTITFLIPIALGIGFGLIYGCIAGESITKGIRAGIFTACWIPLFQSLFWSIYPTCAESVRSDLFMPSIFYFPYPQYIIACSGKQESLTWNTDSTDCPDLQDTTGRAGAATTGACGGTDLLQDFFNAGLATGARYVASGSLAGAAASLVFKTLFNWLGKYQDVESHDCGWFFGAPCKNFGCRINPIFPIGASTMSVPGWQDFIANIVFRFMSNCPAYGIADIPGISDLFNIFAGLAGYQPKSGAEWGATPLSLVPNLAGGALTTDNCLDRTESLGYMLSYKRWADQYSFGSTFITGSAIPRNFRVETYDKEILDMDKIDVLRCVKMEELGCVDANKKDRKLKIWRWSDNFLEVSYINIGELLGSTVGTATKLTGGGSISSGLMMTLRKYMKAIKCLQTPGSSMFSCMQLRYVKDNKADTFNRMIYEDILPEQGAIMTKGYAMGISIHDIINSIELGMRSDMSPDDLYNVNDVNLSALRYFQAWVGTFDPWGIVGDSGDIQHMLVQNGPYKITSKWDYPDEQSTCINLSPNCSGLDEATCTSTSGCSYVCSGLSVACKIYPPATCPLTLGCSNVCYLSVEPKYECSWGSEDDLIVIIKGAAS